MLYKAKRKIEKAKTQVRAKVEHPFRVIKRQFGYVKTRLCQAHEKACLSQPFEWLGLFFSSTNKCVFL